MKNALKDLQGRLKSISSEVKDLEIKCASYQKELAEKKKIKRNIESEIKEYFKKLEEPSVSDHAIVRYLERVKKIDIVELRKQILSSEVLKLIKELGEDGIYPNDGFQLVLKNNVILTIKI